MTLLIRPTLSATLHHSHSFHTASAKPTIAIGGTGLTSLWTAHFLTKKLQDRNVKIIVAGKWDWEEALKQTSTHSQAVFSHEASGMGPVGIFSQSGQLMNGGSEAAGFDLSPDLEAEAIRFFNMYTGWHQRHPDQQNDPASSLQRQRALTAINGYARRLWGDFQGEAPASLSLHLQGGWRLYDQSGHFAKAKMLFGSGAEAIENSDALAQRLPFYKRIILHNQKKGIFFPDDGLVDSNRVRKFLWSRLQTNPQVDMDLQADVRALDVNSQRVCQGFTLQNRKKIKADVTILAMGLANKHLLAPHGALLPLWNIWTAALQGKVKDVARTIPPGSVSFYTQRCNAGAPDGKTMVVAGTRMLLPETKIPDRELYFGKLAMSVRELFGSRIGTKTLQASAGASAATPDDLPVIDLSEKTIVLNPTAHLGLTQSPALGEIAASHALRMLSLNHTDETPSSLNLSPYRIDRFRSW